jgi:23S rRNA (adenine2030-N6)-methyltransferase
VRPSRYSEGFDYRHQFHAGNVGDVWKHVCLAAFARALTAEGPPLRVVDTHAGAGRYRLGPTGEWTAGIGRLDGGVAAPVPPALERYLALAAARRAPDRGGEYPGSPAFVRPALRPDDRLLLVELIDEVRAELERQVAGDARVEVRGGDGLAALVEAAGGGRLFAFVDPPFTRREEWAEVGDALVAAHRRDPGLHALLWYPIKSLQRPAAVQRQLHDAGVRFTAIDLIVTPLDLKRKALNGSGVLLIGAPPGLAAELAETLPALGGALATHEEWSARISGRS